MRANVRRWKVAKAALNPRVLVPHDVVYKILCLEPPTRRFELQLPIYIDRSQYNTSYRNGKAVAAEVKQLRYEVFGYLFAAMPQLTHQPELRAEICAVHFVRLSPRDLDTDDNLRAAFKHIKDTTFAWIHNGMKPFDTRIIGAFDAKKIRGAHRTHLRPKTL